MICYNCGYNLPFEEIKECPLCGMKFPITCHHCKSPNPLMAKFCIDCGTEIRKSNLQSSVKNFDILEENRKKVAVMFADVSGFTALSEKLDPEEVREIINDTFYNITKPVYELEGTIDKYIGDCVMILFGAKHSHSDDPKRAVACGLEMMKIIKDFSEERLANKGINLDLRIGINYGLVVTGSVGNYFDKDYTVMGDIVNTAQRLQTIARKSTILVSESVYNETKDVIEYSKEREITAKNKQYPIKAYSPKRLINIELEHMALVEREDELAFLNSIYKNLVQVKAVTIIGEAGIGKTSLVKQFLSTTSLSKNIFVTCSYIHQNRVYYVISNILLQIMNLVNEDSNRVKINRLKSYIDFILKDYHFKDEEVTKNYQFISLIMGLERDSEFQKVLNSMNYEDLQRELHNQLRIFFLYSLKKNHMLFIVDDLQWADKSSIELLKSIIRDLEDVKTLFIFLSRYEIDDLHSEENYHLLALKNISRQGIHLLSSRLLQSDKVDQDLLNSISKNTNGNPLYIKEFITAIKRKGKFHIKDGIAFIDKNEMFKLPNTIESLILANLNELDDRTRSFLQVASVVGKEFSLSLVTDILEEAIEQINLKLSIKLGLIAFNHIITSSVVDKVYVFNQDTIREVIYNSLLNKHKQEIHRKIGDLIEKQKAKEIENYYDILALHYNLSGETKKAKEYYYKAALKYKQDFNYHASLEYFKKYMDYIEAEDNMESRICVEVGKIYTQLAEYDLAIEYLNKGLATVQSLENDSITIELLLADVYKEVGNYQKSLAILDAVQTNVRHNTNIYGKLLQIKSSVLSIIGNNQALEVAKESEKVLLRTKDYDNLAETMSQSAIIYYSNGDIDNALYYLNKALQYAEKIDNLKAVLRISGNLGIIYHSSGIISKALEYFKKAISLAEKISDTGSYIIGEINLGILYMDKGLFNRAEELLLDAFKNSLNISQIYQAVVSSINLGDLYLEKGDYEKAINFYNQSLDLAKKHGLPIEEGINYLGIAATLIEERESERVQVMLDNAYKLFTETNELLYTGDYYKILSNHHMIQKNYESAFTFCNKSIAIYEETQSDMKKVKSLILKGDILVYQAKNDEGVRTYELAISLAEQLESDYEQAKGYYKIYLSLKDSNSNKAKEALVNAKEFINRLDNSMWKELIQGEVYEI